MATGNVRPADMERITTPELARKFIDEQIQELRAQIGDKKVLLALSGGVDSSVVAALLIKAVGKQLVSVHVNHGLLRKGEPEQVVKVFRDELDANLVYVDPLIASSISLQALQTPSRSARSSVRSLSVCLRKRPENSRVSVFWLRARSILTSWSLVQ